MKHGAKRGGRAHVLPQRSSRWGFVAWSATLALVLFAGTADAGSGWDITVDASVFAENTYVGSDEVYVTPLPSFRASRSVGPYTWFVALPLEGIGVSHLDMDSGLISTLSANFGGRRQAREYSVVGFPVDHSERTRALLAGSPDVSTPVFVEAKLQYPMAVGVLGASVGYHPTSIEHDRPGLEDETRHGVLLSLECIVPLVQTRSLNVAGILGLGFMDGNYADAWFAVADATGSLAAFDAGAGARQTQAAIFADYRISTDVSLTFYASNALLLGDAAASPYTVDKHQQTFLIRTSYAF